MSKFDNINNIELTKKVDMIYLLVFLFYKQLLYEIFRFYFFHIISCTDVELYYIPKNIKRLYFKMVITIYKKCYLSNLSS